MKNLITITSILAAGTMFANAATTITLTDNTYSSKLNYNTTMHGFYLNLASSLFTISPEGTTIKSGTELILEDLTLRGPGTNTGAGVTFGLIVLGESDKTILGMSTGTATTSNSGTTTLSFTGISEDDLILSYGTTYRFLAVSNDVLTAIGNADASITTIEYEPSNTSTVSTAVSGTKLTISNGLAAPGLRGYYDTGAGVLEDDMKIITGQDGTSTFTVTSVVTNVTLTTIPEPSMFGLLAGTLALGLAGTRRRRR